MMEWDVWLLTAVLAKFLIYLSSFFAVGSALFVQFVDRSSEELTTRMKQFIHCAILIAICATFLKILLQAGQLYDDGLQGMYDIEMLRLVSDAPLGISSYLRIAGLALLLVSTARPEIQNFPLIASALMITASFALVGHATRDQFFSGTLLVVHLLAISYWLGALYPLYKLSNKSQELSETADIAERFGKQAAWIVPVLIAVGLGFAITLLGSPNMLISSDYGRLLLVKIIVVAALLGFAALNKFRLVPKLKQDDLNAAKSLRISITFESIAFLMIFLITAILTSAVNLPDM